MFLTIDPRFGFIVPKRELPPATILALRRTRQDLSEVKARVDKGKALAQRTA